MKPKRNLQTYFDAGAETQAAFASRVGLSRSFVSRVVSGERVPSLPIALRIAKAANVPVESLLGHELERAS